MLGTSSRGVYGILLAGWGGRPGRRKEEKGKRKRKGRKKRRKSKRRRRESKMEGKGRVGEKKG